MNKYCYIKDKIVVTVEDEFVDIFPNIHISKRYSKEFIDNCIVVDETVEVRPCMIYEDGVFKEAPTPEYVEPTPTPDPTPEVKTELENRITDLEMAMVQILGGVI